MIPAQYYSLSPRPANKYSFFNLAIFVIEISLGQTASQAPCIGTTAKTFFIHLCHHIQHPCFSFRMHPVVIKPDEKLLQKQIT